MGLFDMPLREQPREVEEKRSLRRSCSGAPGRPLGAYLKEQAQAAAFSSIGSKQRQILPVNVFQMLACADGRRVGTEGQNLGEVPLRALRVLHVSRPLRLKACPNSI